MRVVLVKFLDFLIKFLVKTLGDNLLVIFEWIYDCNGLDRINWTKTDYIRNNYNNNKMNIPLFTKKNEF